MMTNLPKTIFATAILSLVALSAIAEQAKPKTENLTIPKKKYAKMLDFSDAPEHKTRKYPLSDQKNEGKWVLQKQYCEEFEGSKLNTTMWHPNNPGWKGRKPTQFHPSNVTLADGFAQFRVNQHGSDKLLDGYTHSAGFIVSKTYFLYGYYEARLKPNKSPWVAGYWMTNSTKEWRTEIDICENCPGTKGRERDLGSNLHVFYAPKDKGDIKEHFSTGEKYKLPFDLSDDFHVWGMDWSEESVKLYLDGVLYREVKNDYWHQELRVNFNNESNKWFGALPDDNFLDGVMLVDYFRVWKRK